MKKLLTIFLIFISLASYADVKEAKELSLEVMALLEEMKKENYLSKSEADEIRNRILNISEGQWEGIKQSIQFRLPAGLDVLPTTDEKSQDDEIIRDVQNIMVLEQQSSR